MDEQERQAIRTRRLLAVKRGEPEPISGEHTEQSRRLATGRHRTVRGRKISLHYRARDDDD